MSGPSSSSASIPGVDEESSYHIMSSTTSRLAFSTASGDSNGTPSLTDDNFSTTSTESTTPGTPLLPVTPLFDDLSENPDAAALVADAMTARNPHSPGNPALLNATTSPVTTASIDRRSVSAGVMHDSATPWSALGALRSAQSTASKSTSSQSDRVQEVLNELSFDVRSQAHHFSADGISTLNGVGAWAVAIQQQSTGLQNAPAHPYPTTLII